MSETFKVGEVAIYVRPDSPYYGQEVKILGPLRFVTRIYDHVTEEISFGERYEITPLTDCENFWAKPEWLSKKRPPQELSSWDEVEKLCGWKPRELTIS